MCAQRFVRMDLAAEACVGYVHSYYGVAPLPVDLQGTFWAYKDREVFCCFVLF